MRFFRFFVCLILLGINITLWIEPANGTTRTKYVFSGATGNNSGSDWTNAITSVAIPFSGWQRDTTYYFADGSYGYIIIDTAVSGTNRIILKKATPADHGTNTGWSDSMGDGQAVFNGIQFKTSYITIDGQTGSGTSGYGFKITRPDTENLIYAHPDYQASDIVVKRCEITNGSLLNNETGQGIDIGRVSNWVIENNYIHHVASFILMMSVNNMSIKNNYLGPSVAHDVHGGVGHGAGIRDTGVSTNVTIANNFAMDVESSGWFVTTGDYTVLSNYKIYNNIIMCTETLYNYSDGYKRSFGFAHLIALNYGTETDFHVYHNTIVNIDVGLSARVYLGGGNNYSTINVKNNLWYCDAAKSCKPADHDFKGSTGIVDSNWYSSSISHYAGTNDQNGGSTNPFISIAEKNFRLNQTTNPGQTLPAPYNQDMYGKNRGADGVWDRGVYEYNSGEPILGNPYGVGGNELATPKMLRMIP